MIRQGQAKVTKNFHVPALSLSLADRECGDVLFTAKENKMRPFTQRPVVVSKIITHHAPALVSITACGMNTAFDLSLEANGKTWDWTDGWRTVNCKRCLKTRPKIGGR